VVSRLTNWVGRSLKQTPSRNADYADTTASRMQATSGISGKQPGDPVRACAAIIKAAETQNPPRHLVPGAFGVEEVRGKIAGVIKEIDAWKETSSAADFP
jgi:hypothetical protein